MESNQNGILAKLNAILRVLIGNRAIQLTGLVIAILTLIVTVAPNEVRTFIGLEKPFQPSQERQTVRDSEKTFGSPFEYAIHEHQPQFINDAQTSLSVVLFRNIEGEEFVSLNIFPTGEKSSVRAVLSGYTEEFKSSTGVFNVQILNVDYDSKKVVVQVSRKL